MTRNEDQAQEIVANRIVDIAVGVRHCHLSGAQIATELLVLSLEKLVAPKAVYGTVLGVRHEPGARVIGNAALRPLLQRGYQGILSEVFGKADIVQHAH